MTAFRGEKALGLLTLISAFCLVFSGCSKNIVGEYVPEKGDILFQSLPHGTLVDMIEGASESPFSHCGIIVEKFGKWYVLEGIGPVKETSLETWILSGRGNAFAAYRLKKEYADKIDEFIAAANKYMGKPYDIHYSMDDEKIYCSELIYKAFLDAAGKKMGSLKKLGELNWKPYESAMRSIENDLPLDREIITPRAVSEAPQLELIYKSGY